MTPWSSAAYFDGNGAAGAVLTLASWIAIGVAMFLVGERWRAQNAGGQAAAERPTERTTTTTGGVAAPARSSS